MKKQRGMALLMVLLMMSVMAIIAVNINGYWQRSLMRTQSQQDQLRAKWLLLGGEIYAKKWLQQTLDQQTSVNLGQAWAREDLAMRTEEGEVLVRIINTDTCFNLNALTTVSSTDEASDKAPKIAREKQIFMLLLANLGMAESQAEAITDALNMKISDASGAVETGYLIENVSQLREMSDISRELYSRIAPLVCALPDHSLQINLNTVTSKQLPLVRAMLFNALSSEQTLALIAGRPQQGWNALDFLSVDNYPELHKLKEGGLSDGLTTAGSRFAAQLQVKRQHGDYRLISTLLRGKADVKVTRRQFGWGEG